MFFVKMGIFLIALINTAVFVGLCFIGKEDQISIILFAPAAFAIFVITIFISGQMLGLFDEAIMATLLCLAVDMDLNDGVPKFGSPSF